MNGLFDQQPPSHHNAPRGTSKPAADSMRGQAAILRAQVLACIVESGERGMTDEEIQNALGMAGNTERPRRWELERAGLVKDSGIRRVTKAGRKAAVWCIAPEGQR